MKSLLYLLTVWMSPITLVHLAADPQVIQLWPDSAPGEKATAEPERDTTTSKDALISGKPVVRLSNVTDPSLTVYPAPKATETGTGLTITETGFDALPEPRRNAAFAANNAGWAHQLALVAKYLTIHS